MGKSFDDPGKEWPQILAIIVACIPGVTSGLLFSWTSPFILVLMNDKVNYNISEDEVSLLPVLLPVGIMVTSIFFFKIPDIFGRKNTLILLSLPHIIFWIITIFARDINSFYVARFITGIADAIMFPALPIYVGEVATPKVRGIWGTGQPFSSHIGFLIISIIGSYLTIPQAAYICITLPILSVILFLWMPESPYYLIMKGQNEKAKASLQWLLRKKNIESDFLQLEKDVQRQISETGTWADLIKISSNRKALIASMCLRTTQQFSGIGVFESYIQYIFEKSGSTALSSQMSAIIFSGLLFVIMAAFVPFSEKMGRRKSFAFSSLGCSIVLLAEAIYFYVDEFKKEIDLSSMQWFLLVGLVVYIIVYCAGLVSLPSQMSGELFSASIKGKALCITTTFVGILITFTSFIFRTLNSSFGLYAPFLVYSLSTLVIFLLSFKIIPETKGKTLEEIQQNLKGNNKKKNIEGKS